jgi:hypothetical protein
MGAGQQATGTEEGSLSQYERLAFKVSRRYGTQRDGLGHVLACVKRRERLANDYLRHRPALHSQAAWERPHAHKAYAAVSA